MKRISTLVAFLLCSNFIFAQLLVFDFNGQPGNQATSASTFNATTVQASTISRGSGLGAAALSGSFSSTSFTSNASIDVNDYVEFTLTPKPGYEVDIASINIAAFNTKPNGANNGGPSKVVVRTSLDNYASNATTVATVTENLQFFALPFSNLNNISTAITFRIYGYAAENNLGVLFLGTRPGDDISIEGAAQTILPVTFTGFEGRNVKNGTQLTWKVAGEQNVKQYDIERSSNDGRAFTKIGTVPATGSDSYSFTDAASHGGTVFYRIKNIDNDGRFKYSIVLSFKNGDGTVVFKVVPSIVRSSAMVQHSASAGSALITLSTADGQIVRTLRPTAGSVKTDIDMSSLHPGLYLVKWSDGKGAVQTAKVIKQ